MTTKAHRVPPAAIVIILLAMAAAAGGCNTAPTVTTDAQGQYRLVHVYHTGDTWTQEQTEVDQTTTDAELLDQGEPAVSTESTTQRVTATVTSVGADGVAAIKMRLEFLKDTVDGTPQTLDPTLESTIHMDSAGRVVSVEGFDDLAARVQQAGNPQPVFEYAMASAAIDAVLFPDKGLARVGEEWSNGYSLRLPGMDEQLSVTETAKVTAVTNENGRTVAVISHTVELLPFSLPMDMSSQLRAEAKSAGYQGPLSSLVMKMVLQGQEELAGEVKVDLGTGQSISEQDTETMSMSFAITDAPVVIVPLNQRGPYGMRGHGTYTMTVAK